jgi:hypothetical protein
VGPFSSSTFFFRDPHKGGFSLPLSLSLLALHPFFAFCVSAFSQQQLQPD